MILRRSISSCLRPSSPRLGAPGNLAVTETGRLRVVHVASGREWRGGQRQVLFLARGMHAAGLAEVRVVTSAGSELAARLADHGVAVTAIPWNVGLDPRVAIRLAAMVQPDVIMHAHDAHAHAMVDVAARLRGGRSVATRRVDVAIGHPARWRRAHAAIALSAPVADRLLEAGVASDRIHVIPPAVEYPAPDGTTEAGCGGQVDSRGLHRGTHTREGR